MDKLVSKIAALGIPGLVLVTAIGATGLAGGAAITTALAALGPGGILGGIATLGIIGLISEGIAQYGVDAIFSAVIKELYRKGETKEEILRKIKKLSYFQRIKTKIKRKYRKSIKGSLTLMHKIKAVKIYVEFYSFLCIIEVAETI